MERSFNLKQLPCELVWTPAGLTARGAACSGGTGRAWSSRRAPTPTAPPACSGEAKPFPPVLVTEKASVSLLFRSVACCGQRFISFSPGELKPTVVSLCMDPLLLSRVCIFTSYTETSGNRVNLQENKNKQANTQTHKW